MQPTTQISGTYLLARLWVSYAEIVAVLGEPHSDCDGYKTDAQWAFEKEGVVFTLYNYKDGKNYLGEEGLPLEEVTDWHIGGHGPGAVAAVRELFPDCPIKGPWDMTFTLA